MKILLSEHCETILVIADDMTEDNSLSLCKDDFELLHSHTQREFIPKVFPYQIIFSQQEKDCYCRLLADYYIGLEWLIPGKKYIQVEPKINVRLLEAYQKTIDSEIEDTLETEKEEAETKKVIAKASDNTLAPKVDYIKMLLDVYTADITPKEIGNLVKIYWEDPLIRIEQKEDYLTPFLVVQFLGLLKTIVRKGLKKSYYKVQENLSNRVRGKILVGQQIKQNVFKNRLTTIYCEYQVFGEDYVENRFLKKVLGFCISYVRNHEDLFAHTGAKLVNLINYCRPAFELINDDIPQKQLKHILSNPFYNEYKEAINIGNLILQRFAYNISSTTGDTIDSPPFWIDMPRLFELYVYQKLLCANPADTKKIKYQFATYGNYLDFLIMDGSQSIIIDTKYKLHYLHSQVHEDIRQVSGYARLSKVRTACHINDDSNIDCLIIYPTLRGGEKDFTLTHIRDCLIESNRIKAYYKVYKFGVELPLIS